MSIFFQSHREPRVERKSRRPFGGGFGSYLTVAVPCVYQETPVARNFDGCKEEDKEGGPNRTRTYTTVNNSTVVPAYKKPYLAGDYEYVS